MRYLFFLCTIVFSSFFAVAQDLCAYEWGQLQKDGYSLPYRILFPLQYDAAKKYPVVVFLHGAAEKGFDNKAQLNNGGALFLRDSIRQQYPAIVIFPQCAGNDSWLYFETEQDSIGNIKRVRFPYKKEPTGTEALLKALLDSLIASGKADTSRMYIGGLSQGAMGIYDVLARYPGFFTAAFPICGAGNTSLTKKYAGKTALWIFHGEKDPVIDVDYSRTYFKRLKKENADVRYTEYPATGHNSWDKALAEKDLLPWLFSKKKN
jgi:predicted peptidase